MQLILQTANVTADAKNCSYPNKVTVINASELQEAVKMDHVCAEYKNNYRSIDNFLKSNVVVMDLEMIRTNGSRQRSWKNFFLIFHMQWLQAETIWLLRTVRQQDLNTMCTLKSKK